MTVEDIPKIVLHLHLDGSIDINDAFKWALEDGINYTKKDLLKELQVDENVKSLKERTPDCVFQTNEEKEVKEELNLDVKIHNIEKVVTYYSTRKIKLLIINL